MFLVEMLVASWALNHSPIAAESMLEQTAVVQSSASGSRDYMANAANRAFPAPDGQRVDGVSVEFANSLLFNKFDSTLGTLNEVRLIVNNDVHMSVTLDALGSTDIFGAPYPAFGDISTDSYSQSDFVEYLNASGIPNSYTHFDTVLVRDPNSPRGVGQNQLTANTFAVNYNRTIEFSASASFASLPLSMSMFVATGPLDSQFEHLVTNGGLWTIDTYFLNDGETANAAVLPGFPPWHALRYRNAGSYDFEMTTKVKWEFLYTPNGTTVPEPGSMQQCFSALVLSIAVAWARRFWVAT